jgi:hypothetical protein
LCPGIYVKGHAPVCCGALFVTVCLVGSDIDGLLGQFGERLIGGAFFIERLLQ